MPVLLETLVLVGVLVIVVFAIYLAMHAPASELDRRYKEADMRLVGGPFDTEQVNRHHGGDQWPAPEKLLCYRVVERKGKEQWLLSIYELELGGDGPSQKRTLEYRFKREFATAPPALPTELMGTGMP